MGGALAVAHVLAEEAPQPGVPRVGVAERPGPAADDGGVGVGRADALHVQDGVAVPGAAEAAGVRGQAHKAWTSDVPAGGPGGN